MPEHLSNPSTVRFQLDSLGVDWQELISLFRLAELGGREGEKVRRAFENSTTVCFAFDGSRLVGTPGTSRAQLALIPTDIGQETAP